MKSDNEALFRSAADRLDDIRLSEEQVMGEVIAAAAGMSSSGLTLEAKRQFDRIADTTAALGELALTQAAQLRALEVPLRQPDDPDVRKAVRYISTIPDNRVFSAREAGLDPRMLDEKYLEITAYLRQTRGKVYFTRSPQEKGVPRDHFALAVLNPDQ